MVRARIVRVRVRARARNRARVRVPKAALGADDELIELRALPRLVRVRVRNRVRVRVRVTVTVTVTVTVRVRAEPASARKHGVAATYEMGSCAWCTR